MFTPTECVVMHITIGREGLDLTRTKHNTIVVACPIQKYKLFASFMLQLQEELCKYVSNVVCLNW